MASTPMTGSSMRSSSLTAIRAGTMSIQATSGPTEHHTRVSPCIWSRTHEPVAREACIAAINERKHVMDKTQVLAERRLRMERDGIEGAREVVLQIGIPQWSKGGDDPVCAIAIVGLDENMPPVRGHDFFDVLVKAARTMKLYC